jgi:hypothetical protein
MNNVTATMVADPDFIDTNVLAYISRPTAPGHAAAPRIRSFCPTD